MKVISPFVHGIIDYAYAAVLLIAPTLLGLAGRAAVVSYLFAGILIVMSLMTRYPLALARVIPFKVHGVMDGVFVVALLAAAWLAGAMVSGVEIAYFVAMAAAGAAVTALTDWNAESGNARVRVHA